MKLSYNELFLKILAIINYQDAEQFVKGVEERNKWEALANLIEKLPQQARDTLAANPHDVETIKKYITTDVYTEELQNVSTQALAAFLQHLTPVLTSEQKKQIAQVFPN